MEVKTQVYLTESDISSIVKKHIEKEGFKVLGQIQILTRGKHDTPKELAKNDNVGILVEVKKQFKGRISLPNEK